VDGVRVAAVVFHDEGEDDRDGDADRLADGQCRAPSRQPPILARYSRLSPAARACG
jgi:hypothetical protein